MQLDTLVSDDTAVASMLGVTLLLGTAVVGAAVVGAFVLDVGSSQETAPQVQWDVTEDTGQDQLTIQHMGGDTISSPGQIQIYGTLDPEYQRMAFDDARLFGAGSITAGDTATIDRSHLEGDSGTISIVWESSDGSQSVELYEFQYSFQ